MIVNDFKWVKGENDYEYIQLLEAECKHKDEIISRAINKLKADRKTENCSEKPNNCDTCKYGEDKHRYTHICNECGVGINNYEPKTEPTVSKMEQVDKDINVRSKDELQKCSVNGRPYSECSSCEHFKCIADEPQVLDK